MLKHYDVGLTGLWTVGDYGNTLSYFALYKTLEEMGRSVLMLDAREKASPSPMDDFFQAAYGENRFSLASSAEDVNALCDRFLVGSGQVWNYGIAKGFQDRFYLGFANDERPKIAYASSFGHDADFTPPERRKRTGALLERFSAISCREECAKQFLEDVYGVEASSVLDPVLLNPATAENMLLQSGLRVSNAAPYDLLYLLDDNPALEASVKRAAQAASRRLAVVKRRQWTAEGEWEDVFPSGTPETVELPDFLRLTQAARNVVTDSYSGCCVCLALRKVAYAFINHRRGAARFMELYQSLGLSAFLLQNSDRPLDLSPVREADFAEAFAHLEARRTASLECLRGALSNKASVKVRPHRPRKTARELQSELYQKLTTRPVVIMGAGENARNFCERFERVLNIRCALTNFSPEKEIRLKSGTIISVSRYEKAKIQRDDFIILCRPSHMESYRDTKKHLTADSLLYEKDYVSSRLAASVLDKKQTMMFVGYCQLDVMRDIFSRIPEITEKYDLSFFRLSRDTIQESYRFEEYAEMLKLCNALIYVPLFSALGKTDADIESLLASDARACTFPRLAFRGLHPYKNDNLETFHELTRYNGHVHWPFLYAEPAIDKGILDGKSDDEIYADLMREDFISPEEIQKNLKLAFKSIQLSESNTDLKILDYIKSNYQKRLLYRDCLHYQNCLYFEIARRMNRLLGLYAEDGINRLEKQMEREDHQFIDFTEIPILPCVAKALDLEFVKEETLYRVRNFDGSITLMTRKEWIYSYCDYTRTVMKMKRYFNK